MSAVYCMEKITSWQGISTGQARVVRWDDERVAEKDILVWSVSCHYHGNDRSTVETLIRHDVEGRQVTVILK
jgi:hypothetical protein